MTNLAFYGAFLLFASSAVLAVWRRRFRSTRKRLFVAFVELMLALYFLALGLYGANETQALDPFYVWLLVVFLIKFWDSRCPTRFRGGGAPDRTGLGVITACAKCLPGRSATPAQTTTTKTVHDALTGNAVSPADLLYRRRS